MLQMKPDCPLCRDQPYQFAQDDVATARLSDEFACRGHAVLTARRHVENVSDLPAGEAVRFFEMYRLVERALIEVFDADRVLAVKLGLAVPHLHIHLYPVSGHVSRDEVDGMLARRARVEPSKEELLAWVEKLKIEN